MPDFAGRGTVITEGASRIDEARGFVRKRFQRLDRVFER